MCKEIENRLAKMEEKLLSLQVDVDMANQREFALTHALGWLLSKCPDQQGATYLIDHLEEPEANPEQLEFVAVFQQLLEDVGHWYKAQNDGP